LEFQEGTITINATFHPSAIILLTQGWEWMVVSL
jgi:hypothetical protein